MLGFPFPGDYPPFRPFPAFLHAFWDGRLWKTWYLMDGQAWVWSRHGHCVLKAVLSQAVRPSAAPTEMDISRNSPSFTRQRRIHLKSGLAPQFPHHMSVGIHGHADAGMPQSLHDQARMHPLRPLRSCDQTLFGLTSLVSPPKLRLHNDFLLT